MLHSREKQVLRCVRECDVFDTSVSSPQPLGLASIRGLISFEMNSSEPNKRSGHQGVADEQCNLSQAGVTLGNMES